MSTRHTPISDYTDYNYRIFWETENRQYEHITEVRTIRGLLKKHTSRIGHLLDAGCGYGRLFPAYADLAEECALMDYALPLLKDANTHIHRSKVTFVNGNLYQLPFQDAQFNAIISIRTLHHLEKPEIFFAEAFRILKPNGVLITEIPNQCHILNRIRYRLGKLSQNPMEKKPLQKSKTYFNFHPEWVAQQLRTTGFDILEKRNISFFRSVLLKKWFPAEWLYGLERVCQIGIQWGYPTPSIYITCRKPAT